MQMAKARGKWLNAEGYFNSSRRQWLQWPPDLEMGRSHGIILGAGGWTLNLELETGSFNLFRTHFADAFLRSDVAGLPSLPTKWSCRKLSSTPSREVKSLK